MIGNHIKKKRLESNLTSKELSEKLNISIQRLNNFETESRIPSLTLLGQLSEILNFDIDNLGKTYDLTKHFDSTLFKTNIHNYRTKNKLTLNDLSLKINVSRQTISKWEKGESYPNIDDFYSLCKTLKIKPSSLVCNCEKTQNKYKYFLIFIPLIITIIPLLFLFNPKPKIESPNSPQQPLPSPNIPQQPSMGEITTPVQNKLISEETVDLIYKSVSLYNETIPNKQYKISFNDENILDIYYTPSHPIILPYYFGENKYVDHYLLDDQKLSGTVILDFSENLLLTPVYVTYEEYFNSIKYEPTSSNYIIKNINNKYETLIIPETFMGISSFEIRTIYNNFKTLIINNNYTIINGIDIDYLPNNIFINAKDLTVINQSLDISINLVSFKQQNDYNYSSNFITTGNINYLYIELTKNFDNSIYFNNSINTLSIDNNYKEYKNKFLIKTQK